MAAKKSSSPKTQNKVPSGATVKTPVPVPAYQARPGTIPVITLGDLGKSVLTAGSGALITSVFVSSLQGGAKIVGAVISGGIGVLFTATSPIGTITSELGVGMLSSSVGWFVFDLMGKVKK